MENRIHRNREEGATEIKELSGYAFRIPSFTDERKSYVVDLAGGKCSCPRYRFKGYVEGDKHYVLAEAVADARELRFGAYAAEEAVYRMCRRIFDRKPMAPAESYRLLSEVRECRYSTPRMVRAAEVKHRRNIEHGEAA